MIIALNGYCAEFYPRVACWSAVERVHYDFICLNITFLGDSVVDFFSEYAQFLLQAVTMVVSIIVTVATVIAISSKSKLKASDGHIEVKYLNDELDDFKTTLEAHVLDKYQLKNLEKTRKETEKAEQKALEQKAKQALKSNQDAKKTDAKKANQTDESGVDNSTGNSTGNSVENSVETSDHDGGQEGQKEDKKSDDKKCDKTADAEAAKSRLFVVEFDGDMQASQSESLAKEMTAVLQIATPQDEVLIRLESPGGVVHGYGLAASQLARVRDKGIPLTVAVDKVAASGGYMMACLADKIIAAPFAILGSIGVLAQVPNFHRLLKKHDIDYDIYTAGEYKRTVTIFGEPSEKGQQKFKEELEETHVLFKAHVSEFRPQVDIQQIATGEHWYGRQAIDLQLVDELVTSEDYLLQKSASADIFQVSYELKKPLLERLSNEMQGALVKLMERMAHRAQEKHLL